MTGNGLCHFDRAPSLVISTELRLLSFRPRRSRVEKSCGEHACVVAPLRGGILRLRCRSAQDDKEGVRAPLRMTVNVLSFRPGGRVPVFVIPSGAARPRSLSFRAFPSLSFRAESRNLRAPARRRRRHAGRCHRARRPCGVRFLGFATAPLGMTGNGLCHFDRGEAEWRNLCAPSTRAAEPAGAGFVSGGGCIDAD